MQLQSYPQQEQLNWRLYVVFLEWYRVSRVHFFIGIKRGRVFALSKMGFLSLTFLILASATLLPSLYILLLVCNLFKFMLIDWIWRRICLLWELLLLLLLSGLRYVCMYVNCVNLLLFDDANDVFNWVWFFFLFKLFDWFIYFCRGWEILL